MRRSATIATLAALALSCLACAHAQTATADLSLESAAGCWISNDGAGLWSSLLGPPESGNILLQAEDATKLELLPDRQVIEDGECGGGRCVAYVKQADFVFEVAKRGTYQGWARLLLPRPGSWNHEESMDGGARRRISDSAAWIFGQWIWGELGSYGLAPGQHTFTLHGWLGGAQLDAVIFSADPDFDPTNLRGAPTFADTGTITTRSVLPSGVQAWGKVQLDADPGGGAIAVEVSADGGRSWHPSGAGGEVSALPTAGDGTDSVQARLTLSAAADGASPLVRGITVSWTQAEDAEVALATDGYRIAVARHTGALAGIYNQALGEWVTPPHLQQPMVGLAVREPGGTEQTVIPPDQVRFEGASEQDGRLVLSYSALDGAVLLGVEMAADAGPLSQWRITAANNSALEVIRVDFPLIGAVAIGDYLDDECVVPRTGGWRIRSSELDRPWMTTYMGGGSMNWLDVCDSRAGLYVMCRDRALTTSEIGAQPTAGHRGADLSMRTNVLIPPGGSVTREYVIGVHPGDWHWAADNYRQWAYSWMQHPDDPEWVRWCDGWMGAMSTPFAHMSDMLAQSRVESLDYLQYWGQMTDGIDQCCGNFYWPAPALGGAEGFQRGIEQVHALGGKVTGYMNCQTWTPDFVTAEMLRNTPRSELPAEALALIHPLEWFEQCRLYPLDGKPIPYHNWNIMCPASTGFAEHLRFWIVEMYVKRFGTDGVYLDQTGATLAKPCYNLHHGHDNIGAWGMGNTELLRTVVEQARAINPDFIMAIEGSGDALG
ncbi:MAG TPA: DUF6259 domain-containing protein, partial [Armatimonadota bacterium]|nr:DUF6259 domain-containing protein [Armatimonadota bacterium]